MAQAAATRGNRKITAEPERGVDGPGLGVASAIYFGLAFVLFLPALLPGRHIFGTDYLAGGFPFYHFISERLAEGVLPKWVPYVFGGMPLFANPGSTYYPIHFLADVLFPVERVFPIVFIFQFFIAGLGMYLLAQELGCRRWVALVGGLSFQFTGLILSWVYAGHDGRIIVATLAPLLFYFLHGGIRTARPAWFVGASGAIAFALLSFQIQNSYYLLLGAGIWALYLLIHFERHRSPRGMAGVVALGLGAVAGGFLISAINFLPFLDYIDQSPRGVGDGRGYEYSVSFSMPVPEVLSLAVPEHHGISVTDMRGQPLFAQYIGQNPFKLHTEYVGAFVVVLFALGFFYLRDQRLWWFLVGFALFFLSIALGGNTPIYRLYYAVLPGTTLFRAPSLSFFMVGLALVMAATLALERLARIVDQSGTPAARRPAAALEAGFRPVLWVLGAIVLISILGAATAPDTGPGMPGRAQGWLRFAFVSAAIGGTLWFWTARRLATAAAAVLLAVITTADLWMIGRSFVHTVPPPDQMFAADDVIRFLNQQEGPARVWAFPFPAPWGGSGAYGGNYPMLHGVEQVGGEHPNMLQRWNEFVGAGTETYIDWHNLITQAGILETEDGGQAIGFRSATGFLEAANVRFLVSGAPLSHPVLQEVHRGSALVYENVAARPRAYLVPTVRPVPGPNMIEAMLAEPWNPSEVAFVEATAAEALPDAPLTGGAAIVSYEPDRVEVRASPSRRALLVLADNYYPGWRAEVEGHPVPVHRVNHTFRGVYLEPGDQRVVFTSEPRELAIGAWIYGFGMAGLGLFGLALWVQAYRRRRAGAAPG